MAVAKPELTLLHYAEAATELQCEIPAMQAVADVESKGAGFYPSGKLVILFERHKFTKYTKGRFDKTHPQLSSTKPGGYLKGEREWKRFEEAAALDMHAAALSTSFGRFQTMGFNHEACGYATVEEMVADYDTGEPAQLRGFVNFIKFHPAMLRALRNRNWATFARLYNGPNYAINKYDVKMANAYRKFKAKFQPLAFNVTIPQDLELL